MSLSIRPIDWSVSPRDELKFVKIEYKCFMIKNKLILDIRI